MLSKITIYLHNVLVVLRFPRNFVKGFWLEYVNYNLHEPKKKTEQLIYAQSCLSVQKIKIKLKINAKFRLQIIKRTNQVCSL